MNRRHWIEMGVALIFLILTAGGAAAEQATIGQTTPDLGGGHYTIGAGWTAAPQKLSRVEEEDAVSEAVFGPVEETAEGVWKVNEGLFKGTDLMPTWEEIKKEGALKKTFYF